MKLPTNYNNLTTIQRREVRKLYSEMQNWKCQHCGSHLMKEPTKEMQQKAINFSLFPGGIGFLKYPIHLHHDHNTGMTIGAVHARCNAILWQYHGE
jgi:hypothetical protein